MKLHIPEIGDRILLTVDWTFDLYNEERNSTLMEILGDTRETAYVFQTGKFTSIPATIPAGTVLKIDRIYIRKGQEDYSSLSFFWEGARTQSKVVERTMTSYMGAQPASSTYAVKKPARAVRFWAKLSDVNNIEFENA